MNRVIQKKNDPLCLYHDPDLEPAFKALTFTWPSFYILLQEHFCLKSAPNFWLNMAPSADLRRKISKKRLTDKQKDICHVMQQRSVLGFALFTTVKDLDGGRQIFNDMWCYAGKNWQSIQRQIYYCKSPWKMGEMSGGENKVLCLAGEKMRLTTKSAHTKVKQEVSQLFCRNNLHIAVDCDLKMSAMAWARQTVVGDISKNSISDDKCHRDGFG